MSKSEVFNANTSERVTAALPSKNNGEVFNLLHGATPVALPGTLGTAQGSNGIDTPEGTTRTNLSEPVNPHGVLVRNANIESLYPATTAATNISVSTVNGTTVGASNSFAGIAIAFNSFSGTFSQALPNIGSYTDISNVTINNVYSGTSTASAAYVKSSVNASGAGWSQNGNTIVWTNGNYPAFSGASSAAGGRLIPYSGASYFLDISFTDTIEGHVVQGAVGVLSLSNDLKSVRVGLDNFGTSLYGTSEVNIMTYSGTRDSLSFPTNQSLSNDNMIPSVGSRFFRS